MHEKKSESGWWMEGERLEIYSLSTSWACIWNDMFLLPLQRVCLVAFLRRVLNTLNRALWNDVISFSFSEQSTSSSSSYDMIPTGGFGRDYCRQTLAEFRPSCNYFASLCQSCRVKTGCREKAVQTGGRGRGYVVISNERLTKAWELDSGGVWEQLGVQSNFVFSAGVWEHWG